MATRETTSREVIDNFLAQKRLAMVGVSRQPADFSRTLFKEFVARGYDMVPVNPAMTEVEGRVCYPDLTSINPPVDGVVVMTGAEAAKEVVKECERAGIERVWLHRGGGPGAVSPEAVGFCREYGIEVVPGYCPFMFFPETGFGHKAHGFFLKLSGSYPK